MKRCLPSFVQSMGFKVELAERARLDIDEAAAHIRVDLPQHAQK